MAEFSPELFDHICERIAEGESLRAICADADMPSVTSVMRWLAADPTLGEQYARAREVQGDGEFDKAREIAFAATPDTVQVARLQYDAVKWRAGKLRPKVYGERAVIEGPGDNGEHKVTVTADDAFATFIATLGGHVSAPAGGGDGAGAVESESPPEPDHA